MFSFNAELARADEYFIYLILTTLYVPCDPMADIVFIFSVASSYESYECFLDLVTPRKCWVS